MPCARHIREFYNHVNIPPPPKAPRPHLPASGSATVFSRKQRVAPPARHREIFALGSATSAGCDQEKYSVSPAAVVPRGGRRRVRRVQGMRKAPNRPLSVPKRGEEVELNGRSSPNNNCLEESSSTSLSTGWRQIWQGCVSETFNGNRLHPGLLPATGAGQSGLSSQA